MMTKDYLIRQREGYVPSDDGEAIAWEDPKIRFVTEHCKGKSVLDLGCVQHDAMFSRNKLWLHKAIRQVASETIGLDLDESGIAALLELGYTDLIVADAQDFSLDRNFDVIVAGDLIEHLHNVGGFLASCARHMAETSELIVCTPNPWHWHKWGRAFIREVPVNGEHTLWMCPTTLKQIADRFDLKVVLTQYASQRTKDLFLPLPARVRHSSFFSVLRKRP
jgi:2-polyprenyl-3-methyl-5-hydroxy-6-metoxy-1,4-benzoquinol methylase